MHKSEYKSESSKIRLESLQHWKIVKRCTKKSKTKKAVAMAKRHVYEDLYARLETKGEKELYRFARQRDRVGKDVQHVRVLKDKNDNVMVSSEAVLEIEGVL